MQTQTPSNRVPPADDRTLVEASFARVAPRAGPLVERFYQTLFRLAPAVRPMFPADLGGQQKKLVGALALAVGNLRKPEVLAPALVGLGERHAAYPIDEGHFAPVGAALLEALAAEDAQFDEATRAAWGRVYGQITSLMVQGLKQARARA